MSNYTNIAAYLLVGYLLLRNKDKLAGVLGRVTGNNTGSHTNTSSNSSITPVSSSEDTSTPSPTSPKSNSKPTATTTTKTKSTGKLTLKGKTKVMSNPKVRLIFWGNWTTQTPSPAQIETAFKNLFASSYYDVLAQYGSAKPVYLGSVRNTSVPPPKFSDKQIIAAVNASAPNSDTQTINCVMIPTGVKSSDREGDAWHDVFAGKTISVYYGKHDMASIMRAMSEEIGESATDPYQNSAGDQIGDPCENVFVINGVTVEGLWSNKDNKCTGPTTTTKARLVKRKAMRAFS